LKATLKFDLNDPDSKRAHRRCINALNAYLVIYDMQEFLRRKIKYENDDMSDEEYNTYIKVRDKMHKILEDYNINLDWDLE
jgi:hypothetical protein